MKSKIPNILTTVRIVGAVALAFAPLFSPAFFAVYTICGATDALDGFLARKWRCESRFGAKLDSAADLMFYSAMLCHMIPFLWKLLPPSYWMGVGAVFVGRIGTYSISAIKYHRFAATHTYLNKLTGLTLFTLPYLVHFGHSLAICQVILTIAIAACLEEMSMMLFSERYEPERKSIFHR